MTHAVTVLPPDVADHIGDGSHHAEHLPGYCTSILDEIAHARRQNWSAGYIAGLVGAYRAVLRHRFDVRDLTTVVGHNLIDTWTGDDLAHFHGYGDTARDVASAANQRTADVFSARIDRDITEGGL